MQPSNLCLHRFCYLVLLAWGAVLCPRIARAFEPVVAVNDDRKDPIKLVMRQPWYRNTVYQSMPISTVKLELFPSVHIKPSDMLGCTVRVRVLDAAGSPVAESEQTNVPLSKFVRAEVSIATLPAGQYVVEAQFIDVVGKPIHDTRNNPCRNQTSLTIAPPMPHEVTFDQRGVCRIGGKPFFPITMYHYDPGILGLVNDFRRDHGLEPFTLRQFYEDGRKMGINAVHDGVDGATEAGITTFLERCQVMHETGMRTLAVVDPRDFQPGTFPRVVGNPGLLGWYTNDEPGLQVDSLDELPARLGPRHRALLDLDPHHPQVMADNTVSALSIDADFADVVMPDLYPQRGGDTRVLGRAVRELKRRSNGKAIVWPVIQAFQLSGYGTRPNGEVYHYARLTHEELRVLAFDVIACGATGISYYALQTSEGPQLLADGTSRPFYLLHDFPDQREAVTQTNQQLQRLIPALLEGEDVLASLQPTEGDIADCDAHVRAIQHQGTCYVLVTNPGRQTTSLSFGVLGLWNETGRDLYSDATVSLKRGHGTLSLPPYAVHVFAFPSPDAP